MIALDSNILIRYFQRDEPSQAAAAEKFLESRSSSDPGWIAIPVLVELLWVLTRGYKLRRAATVHILEKLLGSNDLVLEHEERVGRALELYLRGRADFADCLITVSALEVGCTRIITFDEQAARDAGMELLS